jgi:hypothetical protein
VHATYSQRAREKEEAREEREGLNSCVYNPAPGDSAKKHPRGFDRWPKHEAREKLGPSGDRAGRDGSATEAHLR